MGHGVGGRGQFTGHEAFRPSQIPLCMDLKNLYRDFGSMPGFSQGGRVQAMESARARSAARSPEGLSLPRVMCATKGARSTAVAFLSPLPLTSRPHEKMRMTT